jgi:hypothetical protein
MEERTSDGYALAKEELQRFLENGPPPQDAANAWLLLGHACSQTGDELGEVHAAVERAQIAEVPYYDVSNAANRLNLFLRDHATALEKDQKRDLATRILAVLTSRKAESSTDDWSRMAWLAIHSGQESIAINLVEEGLRLDPDNTYLNRLAQRLGIAS